MKIIYALSFAILFPSFSHAQWSWGSSTVDSPDSAVRVEEAPGVSYDDIWASPTDPHESEVLDITSDEGEDYPRPGLIPFEFNQSDMAESYPFVSADGLHLLFVHNQGQDWVFYCHRSSLDAGWSVPVPLDFEGEPLLKRDENGASEARLLSGAFYNDENTLYICGQWGDGGKIARFYKNHSADALYTFDRYIEVQDEYGGVVNSSFYSNLSFSAASSEMFVYTDNTTCLKEVSDGVFRESYVVGGDLTLMGRVTPDGLNFITEKTYERPERGELLVLKRNSFDEDFSLDNSWVLYRNDGLGLLQPSYSPAMKSVVLVENAHGGWTENNIYTIPVDLENVTEKYIVPEGLLMPADILEDDIAEYAAEEAVYDIAPAVSNVNRDVQVMEKSTDLRVHSGREVAKIAIGKAFPNPTNGVFYIYYQALSLNDNEDAEFRVFDIAGNLVHKVNSKAGNRSTAIDLSSLPSGTYSVSAVISGLQSEAVKVVLVK